MVRLNISFNAHVPTLHPSILVALLSILSLLRIIGISVTLAPPNLADLNPVKALAPLTNEAQKALNLALSAPNTLTGALAPMLSPAAAIASLSPAATTALQHANIDPTTAIASLAPVLTIDALHALDRANIDPTTAIASLAPTALHALDVSKSLASTAPLLSNAANPHAATAGPLQAEGLHALAQAMTEGVSPSGTAGAGPAAALHQDISAQVRNGTLSKEGAVAAHAALYDVVPRPWAKMGL